MSDYLALALWASVGTMNAGFLYASMQRMRPSIADEFRTGDCFAAWFLGVGFAPLVTPSILLFALWRHGWLFPGSKP